MRIKMRRQVDCATQSPPSSPPAMLLFLLLLLLQELQAEIARTSVGGNRLIATESSSPSARCAQHQHKYRNMVRTIDDVEDLDLDVPVHIALDQRQKKRFVLQLNKSTPLTIQFSEHVARKMYYNQTANILKPAAAMAAGAAAKPGLGSAAATRGGERASLHSLVLPCALRGQYDLFVQARQRGSLKIEAHASHPHQSWPLLNRTHRISIKTQNRVRKRQLIVKWQHSKLDYHAMHYCLVVVSNPGQRVGAGNAPLFANFCEAAYAYALQQKQKSTMHCASNLVDLVWARQADRARRLDERQSLHIVCTGSRTNLLLRGLQPNTSYRLDVYGVHQRRQNLTFHLAHTMVHFNRTHPIALRPQSLSQLKIGGMHGVQVYSYKVPPGTSYVRYLLLPCSGSEIKVKMLRQRRLVHEVDNIYRPTYIKLESVQPGERYLMRFEPSNVDEELRAQKVRLAVSSSGQFRDLPELPQNITVYDVRTRCTSSVIAWHGSPDQRTLSYCIIVLNLPQRNRSFVDYSNYCMDFGAQRVQNLSDFQYMKCRGKQQNTSDQLETETILSLTPGASYLIYVTANLSIGKPLPYQTLTVHMASQCASIVDASYDSLEQLAYY
ncbi:uncharacterized protein LOC115624711 [Scaptodrosophila lebanonensis]|uniref:Uncharacterized protein LOC115624711 n=1 Tax=Drosophila lebanonensis TaxID=7225 RepID=A0A6J2TJT1_DROLE|nr:uncharacterized protein LOC115624711 [Scaptodrosophila lebanonensis]